MSNKNKKTIIKTRNIPVDFSTHTRKTPTFHEKKIRAERKYKKDLTKYEE